MEMPSCNLTLMRLKYVQVFAICFYTACNYGVVETTGKSDFVCQIRDVQTDCPLLFASHQSATVPTTSRIIGHWTHTEVEECFVYDTNTLTILVHKLKKSDESNKK